MISKWLFIIKVCNCILISTLPNYWWNIQHQYEIMCHTCGPIRHTSNIMELNDPSAGYNSRYHILKQKSKISDDPNSLHGHITTVMCHYNTISCFYIQQCNESSIIQIKLWTHKRYPIHVSSPQGWTMGCLLWGYWRKLMALSWHCTVFINNK